MPSFLSDSFFRALAPILVAVFLFTGCAATPPPDDPDAVAEYHEINDPAEPTMRAIFEFNRALDTLLLKPAATFYKDMTPPGFQTRVYNFLNNLRSPIIFLNDILQGETERAGTTFVRFLVNSTIGVLGLGDPATDLGWEYHDEDFGQTLAIWGMQEGPYVMLPVFGPSNPRDAVGMVVDFFIDPFSNWARNTDRDGLIISRTATRGVDSRARHYDVLEDLEKSSLDYYAAIRSLYRQHRADAISNGESDANMPAPSINEAPEPDRPAAGEEVSAAR
jgi:phospholipid-binding lipoprotein MlaA